MIVATEIILVNISKHKQDFPQENHQNTTKNIILATSFINISEKLIKDFTIQLLTLQFLG